MILNFSFKIGSVFKNIFFSYQIDFLKKTLIYNDKTSNCLNYEKSYVNRLIKDGCQWKLNIKTLFKEKAVHGDNAYPDNFDQLIELNNYIEKILKEE